ncbi:hypothetical protein OR573_11985 [Halomonas sp. CH40]
MKAILHIGTEKTGTTTLQNFLVKNRPAFLEKGYYIPESVGVGNNRGLASCSMEFGKLDDYYYDKGIDSQEKRGRFDKELVARFTEEIERLEDGYHTVILSSEHFHSRCVSKNEVENVRKILRPLFEEIKVVVYLRPQVDMAVSLYSTNLRSGSSSEFYDFLKRHCQSSNPYYNYDDLLNKWSQVFGGSDISVRIFDRNTMLNGDIVDDFFDVVGFDGDLYHFDKVKNLNESLTPFGQEILRLSNKYNYGFNISGVPFKVRLLQLVDQEFIGKGCSPSSNLAKEIQGYFEKINKNVAEKWFERKKLFDFNFEYYGEGRKLEDGYKVALETFFSCYQDVMPKEIDVIRDAAIVLESENVKQASELMQLALKLRPNGALLKKKMLEYKDNMDAEKN